MILQKTNKALCFNPGDYGAYSNVWFQRQRGGEFIVVFPSGDLLFIKLDQEKKVEVKLSEKVLELSFRDEIKVDQIGLGNINSVLPYNQTSLPELFRRHPGLLRPDIKSQRQSGMLLSSIRGSEVLVNGNELIISASNMADTGLPPIWSRKGLIPEIQERYISWLVSNLLSNSLKTRCINSFTLEEFVNCTINYLKPEIHKELTLLVEKYRLGEQTDFKKLKLNDSSVKIWVDSLARLANKKEKWGVKLVTNALVGPLGRL